MPSLWDLFSPLSRPVLFCPLFGMADTIRGCYDTLCHKLNDLSNETSLPGTISQPLKTAHRMMSTLGDTARTLAQEDIWKVMKVMVHLFNAFPVAQILH